MHWNIFCGNLQVGTETQLEPVFLVTLAIESILTCRHKNNLRMPLVDSCRFSHEGVVWEAVLEISATALNPPSSSICIIALGSHYRLMQVMFEKIASSIYSSAFNNPEPSSRCIYADQRGFRQQRFCCMGMWNR